MVPSESGNNASAQAEVDGRSDEPPDVPVADAFVWRSVGFADAPFWKEVEAFNQLPQITIDKYYGQYVAVYLGNIVDADPDEAELALRFYRTFGYVPVYIHKVGTEEGLVDTEDR